MKFKDNSTKTSLCFALAIQKHKTEKPKKKIQPNRETVFNDEFRKIETIKYKSEIVGTGRSCYDC